MGDYTPLCVRLLPGQLGGAILGGVWLLGLAGVGLAVSGLRVPRWVGAGLYIAVGWLALLALPALWNSLPPGAVASLLLGGALYTASAAVYALRWPDPLPRLLGFHEVFHLLVVAGSVVFATAVWVWAAEAPVR